MFPLYRCFTLALFLGSFASAAPLPKELRTSDQSRIQGKWQVIQRIDDGKDRGTGVEDCYWIFKANGRSVEENNEIEERGTYSLDEKSSPKQLDLRAGAKKTSFDQLGLYELEGDKLILLLTRGIETHRPESMDGKGCKIILKRVKE